MKIITLLRIGSARTTKPRILSLPVRYPSAGSAKTEDLVGLGQEIDRGKARSIAGIVWRPCAERGWMGKFAR